jgi:hypothetical protein
MSTITVSPTMIHSQVAPQNKLINKIGFWAALVAFAASVGFDVAQMLQVVGFVTYPWLMRSLCAIGRRSTSAEQLLG